MRNHFKRVAISADTQKVLRWIAEKKDTDIYKVVRDLANAEKKKILAETIIRDRLNDNITTD